MNNFEQYSLTIRVEKDIKEAFDSFAKNRNMTQRNALCYLLDFVNEYDPRFTDEEQKLVDDASNAVGKTKAEITYFLWLRYLRNFANRPKSEIDPNPKYSKYASARRSEKLLREMMDNNDNSTERMDKKYINLTSLIDYSRTQKTLNGGFEIGRNVAKRCIEKFAHEIEKHHKKHNLQSGHNLLAYLERKTKTTKLQVLEGDNDAE